MLFQRSVPFFRKEPWAVAKFCILLDSMLEISNTRLTTPDSGTEKCTLMWGIGRGEGSNSFKINE